MKEKFVASKDDVWMGDFVDVDDPWVDGVDSFSDFGVPMARDLPEVKVKKRSWEEADEVDPGDLLTPRSWKRLCELTEGPWCSEILEKHLESPEKYEKVLEKSITQRRSEYFRRNWKAPRRCVEVHQNFTASCEDLTQTEENPKLDEQSKATIHPKKEMRSEESVLVSSDVVVAPVSPEKEKNQSSKTF